MKNLGRILIVVGVALGLTTAYTVGGALGAGLAWFGSGIAIVGILFYVSVLPSAAVDAWKWFRRNRVPKDYGWRDLRNALRIFRNEKADLESRLTGRYNVRRILGERTDLKLESFGFTLEEFEELEVQLRQEITAETLRAISLQIKLLAEIGPTSAEQALPYLEGIVESAIGEMKGTVHALEEAGYGGSRSSSYFRTPVA